MKEEIEMVNKGDYAVDKQQCYKIIAALGSAIYLLPISNKEMDSNVPTHKMTEIKQKYSKIEYVKSK